MQTISQIKNMLKKATLGEKHARNLKLGLHDGAWYSEHNGIICVTLSLILVK